MRKLLISAGLLPLLACSAEDLDRIQKDVPAITELAHTVATRLQGSAVVLTVTRHLRNDSPDYEEVTHPLSVPEGAVLTALRIGDEGALLDADEAASRWSELIRPGDAEPTTSAILEWVNGGQLELRIFGLAPGATVSVEYDLQLPLVYDSGSWIFDYPRDDSSAFLLADPSFDLSRTHGAAIVHDSSVEVRLPRAPIDRTEARWALLPLGPDRTMWRLELDAATVLEPAALRPNVVFVIDASHSQKPEGIAAQLELLAPYLANAPDAQVEIVLYRRFAERLFGRFIPASDVPRMLASISVEKLAPGNGSNLELGARLAVDALAQVSGAARIVLFTDEELRDDFSAPTAIAELARAPAHTVVHVVHRAADNGTGELRENRESTGPLDSIATAGGGIYLRVAGHPEDPAAAASALLGLVRPIRIDDFAIEAKGLDADRLDTQDTLPEGSTLRFTAIAPRPPAEVTITGKIWARAYRKVLTVDPDLSRWMPGLAIGLDEIEPQLSHDEVRGAALSARAVSRATSFLSARPLAGASTVGKHRGGSGGYGFGTIGCGCSGSSSSGCGGALGISTPPDYDALLRALLAPQVAACARDHGPAVGSISIEATGDEIVGVETCTSSAELTACITERVWAVRLTEPFSTHRTYQVDL